MAMAMAIFIPDGNVQYWWQCSILMAMAMAMFYTGWQCSILMAMAMAMAMAMFYTGWQCSIPDGNVLYWWQCSILMAMFYTGWQSSVLMAMSNTGAGVPDGPPYVEDLDFSVAAGADVPVGGIATMFAAIRLGSSDYKKQLFGNLTTRAAAEFGLTNFVADIPGASVEAGDLSRGYEPDMVLALAAVKVENTKNSTEAKNKLEEYREETGFNVEALNTELVNALGEPPINGVSYVTKFEEIRISVPNQDRSSGPGRVIVYFVLTMGTQEYRDLLLNQIAQAGNMLSAVTNFLESASDVELLSIGKGSGDLDIKAVFEVVVQGTQSNSEARDLLQSLPLDEYSETATTAIREALNGTSLAQDFVTKVVIYGASAKKDHVPEEGRSSSASITLQDVTFQESDYEEKTRAYLDFENEYLSNMEGLVKRKCACEAAAEIASVTFSNDGGKRKLMATAATIETRLYNVDNSIVESALSDLEEQCKTEEGCTLGGFSASVDAGSWRPLDDTSAVDPDNAACAAHVCSLTLLVALLMGTLVK
ncbi:hypothetical protein DUNSADRAFT_13556 [Dunaliella salina]|uniref:Uncharacterized protein n=1 Tax=Dunaliella salina TaxID=3046 RepID=A0ABQ7H338_DUNSA|nr:hypothetical protein DUNSADRAFT_13556 [Dunaliella salina]|eukprot:KAF5841283.1 hypothetical protein DUNSADRAFT_13556 [Dunaliella salina]